MPKIIFSGSPRKTPRVRSFGPNKYPSQRKVLSEEERERLRIKQGSWKPFGYLPYYVDTKPHA